MVCAAAVTLTGLLYTKPAGISDGRMMIVTAHAEPFQEEHVLTSLLMNIEYGASLYMWKDVPNGKNVRKTAYLTFDDGPSDHTGLILDILRQAGVHATFFVIGQEEESRRRMYRQIVAEGHVLGNHTYSHDYNKIYRSVQAFKADVDKLNDVLWQTAGVRPEIIRFPGGSNNRLSRKAGGRRIMANIAREMSNIGIPYFDWNVSSTDAAAAVVQKETIINSVKTNSAYKNEIIVLMHDVDVKRTTVEALPDIIAFLKRDGYEFKTLHKNSFCFQFLHPYS